MSGLRLLLITDAVGGVWTYSLELARALQPFGVETVLAVTGPSPSDEQREAATGIELIDTGLALEWLDTNAAAIRRAGDALAALARREGADIVQTSSAALLGGADFDCPTVAVQHSCVATWWSAVKRSPLPDDFEWRRDLVATGLRRAGAVIAPTRAFAMATGRTYDLEAPVLAVHNGRTPRHLPDLPQGEFVLTAGRLWDQGKNVQTLDQAAARIGVPFQAAGPVRGPHGASVSLEQLTLLGPLSESRLGGLLAARPVFASAALYEPFGLTALEAAQAGCALVLSDIDTHRELWDGAAIFVDASDAAGFAEAIDHLLDDPAQRHRLGERARTAARRYTPERMASAMVQVCARVAAPQAQLIAGAA